MCQAGAQNKPEELNLTARRESEHRPERESPDIGTANICRLQWSLSGSLGQASAYAHRPPGRLLPAFGVHAREGEANMKIARPKSDSKPRPIAVIPAPRRQAETLAMAA